MTILDCARNKWQRAQKSAPISRHHKIREEPGLVFCLYKTQREKITKGLACLFSLNEVYEVCWRRKMYDRRSCRYPWDKPGKTIRLRADSKRTSIGGKTSAAGQVESKENACLRP